MKMPPRPSVEQAPTGGRDDGIAPGERWGFAKGEEIAPGRIAVRRLGGGERYETYLAWDERLLALVVVKIVRPHLRASARFGGSQRKPTSSNGSVIP